MSAGLWCPHCNHPIDFVELRMKLTAIGISGQARVHLQASPNCTWATGDLYANEDIETLDQMKKQENDDKCCDCGSDIITNRLQYDNKNKRCLCWCASCWRKRLIQPFTASKRQGQPDAQRRPEC